METQEQFSTFSLPRSPDSEQDVTAYAEDVIQQVEET